MANPFYDAVQDLEKSKKLIQEVIDQLNKAMTMYEENAESDDHEHKPPSSQLPA